MRKFVCKIASWPAEDIEAESMEAAAIAYVVATGLEPPPPSRGRLLVFVHAEGGSPPFAGIRVEQVDGEWKAVPS